VPSVSLNIDHRPNGAGAVAGELHAPGGQLFVGGLQVVAAVTSRSRLAAPPLPRLALGPFPAQVEHEARGLVGRAHLRAPTRGDHV
jgi:hypothetical protein